MKISEYIKSKSIKYEEDYLNLKLSIANNNYTEFRKTFFDIGNLLEDMLKKIVSGGDFFALIDNYSKLGHFDEIYTLHYIRIVRNKTIHDRNFILPAITMAFVCFLAENFIIYYAKKHENINIDDNIDFILPSDMGTKNENNDNLDYYNNFEKENISVNVSEEYEPIVKMTEIKESVGNIIMDYVFGIAIHDEIIKKYNISGQELNNYLEYYGYDYDWIEFLKNHIRSVEVYKQFIDDFFDPNKDKYKIIDMCINAYYIKGGKYE